MAVVATIKYATVCPFSVWCIFLYDAAFFIASFALAGAAGASLVAP